MWSYYGAKKRIAKYYPESKYDIIIEPFAGSAQYSLFGDNWKKQVILIDKYIVIVNLWKWLINVSKEEINDLPLLKENETLNDYPNLKIEAKFLIGFFINSGSAVPKKKVKKFNSWNEKKKEYIIKTLEKIRHWKVFHNEYTNIPNKEATWFIDPPYQFGGEHYHSSVNNKHLDFNILGKWCQNRNGQVIVCENDKANWLPFKPLVELHGQKHKTMEVIWYKD